jgi:deoxyribodipyrimidine photolyase-like uncharacterized protein
MTYKILFSKILSIYYSTTRLMARACRKLRRLWWIYLSKEKTMIESNKLLHQMLDILDRWQPVGIEKSEVEVVLKLYKEYRDELLVRRNTLRSPDK